VPLKSLLVALLVPPANLVLVCLVGIVLGLHRSRAGRILTILGVCGLFILAMPISGALLFASLEKGLPLNPSRADPPGAIVVLTGDEGHGDGLVPEIPSVGPLSLERLRATAVLRRRVGLPILITGGSLHPGEEPLAAILSRSLDQDFGVKTRWLETGSHTTWQSAENTAALLRGEGITSIYLVTHGWHMRRSLLAFSRFGIQATAAPVRMGRPIRWLPSDLIPTTSGWQTSYYGLHEWIGCAYYALR
jgi:uncharacterized SAM-binding protein YcdF (DUF218 family)